MRYLGLPALDPVVVEQAAQAWGDHQQWRRLQEAAAGSDELRGGHEVEGREGGCVEVQFRDEVEAGDLALRAAGAFVVGLGCKQRAADERRRDDPRARTVGDEL